jgi:hypothetical protein
VDRWWWCWFDLNHRNWIVQGDFHPNFSSRQSNFQTKKKKKKKKKIKKEIKSLIAVLYIQGYGHGLGYKYNTSIAFDIAIVAFLFTALLIA